MAPAPFTGFSAVKGLGLDLGLVDRQVADWLLPPSRILTGSRAQVSMSSASQPHSTTGPLDHYSPT